MPDAPQQPSQPIVDKQDKIEDILQHSTAAEKGPTVSQGDKHASGYSLTSSAASPTLPIPLQRTTHSMSNESIQPLRNDSEKSYGDMLPVKPEPIYAREANSSSDPEKQEYYRGSQSLTPGFTPTQWPVSSPSQPSTIHENWNCEYMPDHKPPYETHLGIILLYLSLLSPLVAMVLSIYSLATAFVLVLLTPFSLCIRRQPFSKLLSSSVSPALRIQLRMIYHTSDTQNPESAGRIAAAAILAPFYSLAIAFAAWVAATFWAYAAILGEPNQRAGEEQDGRAAIRAVRSLWERWLLWGLQQPDPPAYA